MYNIALVSQDIGVHKDIYIQHLDLVGGFEALMLWSEVGIMLNGLNGLYSRSNFLCTLHTYTRYTPAMYNNKNLF